MQRFKTAVSLTLLLLLALSAAADTVTAGSMAIVRQDEGYLFREGPDKVFFYQLTAKSLNGKYKRSNYIHPLYDLDGNVLTEDFPEDHRHHRGIFWAWHQVVVNGKRVGDQWINEDSTWEVQDSEIFPRKKGSAAVSVKLHWKSPRWIDDSGKQKPFVEEITTVRAHAQEGNIRKIDFTIELTALEDDVRIGGSEDVKGYGGFSTRIRLPKDIRFLGHNGPVIPRVTSVRAGPWLDFSGSYGAKPGSGLTVLTHPSSPGFPQSWILRSSGSMQNAAYPGRHLTRVPTDESLKFRYRLIVHRGELTRDRLDQFQDRYVKEDP
ncbi:MAG: PmoA family protein [Bryobacterales bacterium]|nr:PmoA family protein [Bryobacterales bacterium]